MSDALPSLIIAASDLKVVSLLRDAINSGLPKTGPLGTIPPGANPATPRVHPKFSDEPRLPNAPRPVLHPTPRFEPRLTIHPHPRIEEVPPQYVTGSEYSASKSQTHAIKPIWSELPPISHEVVNVETKVVRQTVELIHKGTLLDLFV